MTTEVEASVSLRDGQVTFFSSILTSLKNCLDFWYKPGSLAAALATAFFLFAAFFTLAESFLPFASLASCFFLPLVESAAFSSESAGFFFFVCVFGHRYDQSCLGRITGLKLPII